LGQLSSNLGSDDVVEFGFDLTLKLFFLLRCEQRFVSLHKNKQGLVPQHGKRFLLADEPHEVRLDRVYHSVR